MMREHGYCKIVATLGPATSSQETINGLLDAGADVFRLNMSHGDRDTHRNNVKFIRHAERERKQPIGILADLQGPKLRVGDFEDGSVTLEAGSKFRFDMDTALGTVKRAPLMHPEIFEALKVGDDLLLDDGKIRLKVEEAGPDFAVTKVISGGVLSNHKGVNLPGTVLPLSALTEKDRSDLTFVLDQGVDWVALSFVQRGEDVSELRSLIDGRAFIVAKIEKPAAVDSFAQIVELTDAVMVARGDLGVEMPPEDVPAIQKQLVLESRNAGKPVIVATQMMESMIDAAAPTRAEASDVANAVYEGADAVMLSAETAVGANPATAVEIMDRIIRRTEDSDAWQPLMLAAHTPPQSTSADAITAAARQVADTIEAAAIVTYTTSGSTALRASRERPSAPILCLTGSDRTARKLTLAWGVECRFSRDARNVEEMVDYATDMAREHGVAKAGDRIVITAGMPFGTPGTTNILRIVRVK
jgi:pyruvate kinase